MHSRISRSLCSQEGVTRACAHVKAHKMWCTCSRRDLWEQEHPKAAWQNRCSHGPRRGDAHGLAFAPSLAITSATVDRCGEFVHWQTRLFSKMGQVRSSKCTFVSLMRTWMRPARSCIVHVRTARMARAKCHAARLMPHGTPRHAAPCRAALRARHAEPGSSQATSTEARRRSGTS